MTLKIDGSHLVWKDNRDFASAAFELRLQVWSGTPYESGQSARGLGADCIGSIFGLVNELRHTPDYELPHLPPDTAMHDRATAVATMRQLVRDYAPSVKVRPTPLGVLEVQPGDIVVTGTPGGGPGHVMMVGPQRNTLWHSTKGPGFHQAGWGFAANQVVWAVYRLTDLSD